MTSNPSTLAAAEPSMATRLSAERFPAVGLRNPRVQGSPKLADGAAKCVAVRVANRAGTRDRARLAPKSVRTPSEAPADAAGLHLPAPDRDRREDRVYALLGALCFLTLVHQLWSLLPDGADWHDFVQLVRHLMA